MNMLEVSHIKKSFGSKRVLDDLSFSIPENTIFGFVGENGAGKTTTMKMILGLLKIDEGKILVNGREVTFGNTPTNKFVGYLPDVPEFYSYMTAAEYLKFAGKIAGVPENELKPRINELLGMVGLEGEKHRIKGFSRGMKQRLGIAQALIQKPLLLICDEPTSALDPIGRKEILDVLVRAKQETTIIFSTHILSDVERICDRVAFLHNGKIVINDTIENLKKDKESSNYEILLKNMKESDMKCLIEYMRSKNIEFEKMDIHANTLEKLFLEVAGKC
ncbi:MAG: ABC transporter ATP-binding protein [Lachnospiraceae bacterium]